MIAFLKGKIELKKPNSVVLNIQDAGLECIISLYTYEKLPAPGNSCRLLTYLHVREDILQLYGFFDEKEKGVFLKLISLSGIGPKQAINILSGIRYDLLTNHIINGDVAAVKRAPGVGDKTARRIILELKEKISDEEVSAISGIGGDPLLSANVADALLALESLGYKRSTVQNTINKFIKDDETINTETIIKRFLNQQNK
ncbi:MAG: Holliday junction branch migration protein RuvA [Candidatus Neomarinimicrobiota bacterium]|jgi:Holliday junction DNA helicase RuvA|nr:Holliday junction branch migration protein RuvA [Candidatus Neomarinimicrobiota bacterium]MDX9780674.1 Holliday junction branch migration protein RuvA [bacterium]